MATDLTVREQLDAHLKHQGDYHHRLTLFDHQNDVIEVLEITDFHRVRSIARDLTRRVDVAYATIRHQQRLDIYARGMNRLRLRVPQWEPGVDEDRTEFAIAAATTLGDDAEHIHTGVRAVR